MKGYAINYFYWNMKFQTITMKKILLYLFILFVGTKAVLGQAVNLNGENYLMLNGERFKNQKILLTKAVVSWFAAPNDGH